MTRPRKIFLGGFGAVAAIAALGVLFGACVFAAPTWKGPATDHFDGAQFRSPGVPIERPAGLGALLKWQASRKPGPWSDYRELPFGPRPPEHVAAPELRVTFINHATTLVQLDGVNLLTDPIYSDRASPVSFAGPHRVRPPGVRFTDLPPIDAVVLSHNHYDHLDLATLKQLQATFPAMQIFAGLGIPAYLEREGLTGVHGFDWWEQREVKGLMVQSVPNQHFSNRGITDADGTLWSAWVFHGKGGRAYFAGDTGYGPHFKRVGEKLGPLRLAILPIGAWKPEWFMEAIHMSPAQAVQAAEDLQASTAVAMHFGTFPLADDGETEAVTALQQALVEKPRRFWALEFGEGRQVPALEPAP